MRRANQQTPANRIVQLNALSEVANTVFAPAVSSAKLTTWRGFRLERHCIAEDTATPEIAFPAHIIGFLLGGKYKKDVCDNETRRRTVAHTRGSALLYPAGLPHIGHSFSKADFLVLYLEPQFVERAAQDILIGEHFEIVPQPTFYNEFISDIAKHLLAEVESNGANGALYAGSLMTALAVKLIKNYSTARVLPHECKGGLSKRNLRIIIEFVDEHLSENLSLETLAALCDLSQFHFAKAFKQSTGLAPHEYLLRQRIERAKHLLLEAKLNVAEIALTLGFADQPHFTKIFRRHTGATPTGFQLQSR